MILCPKQDYIPAWELLLVCGASMFLVAAGGGLEDFLRKLEAAQRELQLPMLDAAEARQRDRQRRNVVKRPGVSYERGDDDAVGLRGPGAGSDDADQESLQGFDEPSLSDNEASDEAAILRELEEINSGSDTVKRGTKTSKRNKRHRYWPARDYGQTYKETETSKQLQTPGEEEYGVESMSGHDLASPESGHPTLRMRGLSGNTTAGSSASENLLDVMRTRKIRDKYSNGIENYPRNMQRSLLDTESEAERTDSHEETFEQKRPRKAENIQSSDINSQIGNEDDTLQGFNFRNLENELESDMNRNSRNGAPIRRDHKITPHQRNTLVYRQKLGQAKNGIQSGRRATFSDEVVKVPQNERIEKNNFGDRETERKKLTGAKLKSWNELNNNDDDNSYSSGGGRRLSYTDRHPEGKVFRNNDERRMLMEKAPVSKHERGIAYEKNSKYRKQTRYRDSFAPVANYDSKKQRKAVTKTKEPFNREKYSMARQPHSGKSSVKQKHSLRNLGGNDIASAATKEQLILEDSPGNFDLFDLSHSSRQRSSAKSPKDDDSFHFLWDSQFEDHHHHHSPPNKTKKENEEHNKVHSVEIKEKKEENSSITVHSVHEIEGQTKHEAGEDPSMEDVHSGKTIIGVMDEVMRQVEQSHLVKKHLGPFLSRDHAAEAEAHGAPEGATECGGGPCPSALLSKLTDAVAAIVSTEVRQARCEHVPKRLHCFLTWLLQGAAEQFRPKNPGYVDPKRLAFYAAYYEEAGLVPPPPPPTAHPHKPTAEGGDEGNPCGEHKVEGTCAASKQVHEEERGRGGEGGGGIGRGEGEEDNERERQIRLLKQLLKEYHTLSSREQTRLHSVHQYLEQQLAALHAATTPFPSAAHLAAPAIEIGAEEEGVAEELARWSTEGSPMEPSLVEKTMSPAPLESALESAQGSIVPQETALEQQMQVVEQESAPVMGEDFSAESGAGAAVEVAAEASVAGESAAEAAAGEAIADEVAAEAAAGEPAPEAAAAEGAAGEAAAEAVAGESAAETAASQAASQREVEQMGTEDALAQTVGPMETEDELIEKDLELLGLGNSSNFGTKFNLAPLGHHRAEGEHPQEEEEEEGPEAEGEARSRMQKRAAGLNATEHTPRPARNASDATTKAAAPQRAENSMSPQPPLAEHSLTDPEERYVLLPLLDNADALQRRRRRR